MGYFWTFVFWIFFCCLIGALAKKDGRNFWAWFFISAVASPLLGGMILLISHLVKDNSCDDDKNTMKEVSSTQENT